MGHFALVILGFDYIIVDPTKRKFATYREIGWNDQSIIKYVSNKKNHERIADFITNKVSFSASSRINRFYEIYNRPEMLKLEEAYPDALEGITSLSNHFEIFIITDRTQEIKNATISHLLDLGFPMQNIKVFFKKTLESMHLYKKTILREINLNYQTGVAVITHPKDAQLFSLYEFSVLGFDSIKEESEFDGKVEFVCHNWKQIQSSLEKQ